MHICKYRKDKTTRRTQGHYDYKYEDNIATKDNTTTEKQTTEPCMINYNVAKYHTVMTKF